MTVHRVCACLTASALCVATFAVSPQSGTMRYCAAFGGSPVGLHPVRVSAYPFNRVWAGRQRSVEQTRIAYMAMFQVVSNGIFSLCATEPLPTEYVVRPLGRKRPTAVHGRCLTVEVGSPESFTIEFPGTDWPMLHVFAESPECSKRLDSIDDVVYAAGEHDAGTIRLKDGMHLRIEEGATVYGRIVASGVTGATVSGRGILDSSRMGRENGGSFFAESCTNMTVKGIVFRDSPLWTMTFCRGCRDITVDGIKIVGQWRHNTDGIDVCASEDVLISNCFIRTFDDCIVVRGAGRHGEFQPTRNIRVENCVLWCDWGCGFKIQAQHLPTVIEDVSIRHSAMVNIQPEAVRVTTRYGSAATHIRRVSAKDIEVDFVPPLYREREQRDDGDTFTFEPANQARLVVVNSYRLGDPPAVSDGQDRVVSDVSRFSLLYEDLTFGDFRVYGRPPPQLVAQFVALPSAMKIQRVNMSGFPVGMQIVRTGDVNIDEDVSRSPESNSVLVENQVGVFKGQFGAHVSAGGRRYLFVGNSITQHEPSPELGWYNDCGMAASSISNDYVHVFAKKAAAIDSNACFRVLHVASHFERDFMKTDWRPAEIGRIADAGRYNADVIIVFLGANVPKAYDARPSSSPRSFAKALSEMLAVLDPDQKAMVLLSEGFYSRPVLDAEKFSLAKQRGWRYVRLGDLRGRGDVRGSFNHPNDIGMRLIAERFWSSCR